MNKFEKVAKPSATTRWIISTVLAVSAFTPAITTVLPEFAGVRKQWFTAPAGTGQL